MPQPVQAEPEIRASWVAEEERLAILQRSRLLDWPAEPEFDRWTAALLRETGAAVAAFVLVDATRLVVKSLSIASGPATEAPELSAPLSDVLSELVAGIERYEPSVIPCVVLLDRETNTLHPGAGPSLPPHYLASIDGGVIGPNVGTSEPGCCARVARHSRESSSRREDGAGRGQPGGGELMPPLSGCLMPAGPP